MAMEKNIFKGMVEEMGRIVFLEPADGNPKTYIMKVQTEHFIEGLKIGNDITVKGVCLTVRGIKGRMFEVHLLPATQTKTNLLKLKPGDFVNLEKNHKQ